jgi:hypothetical protein
VRHGLPFRRHVLLDLILAVWPNRQRLSISSLQNPPPAASPSDSPPHKIKNRSHVFFGPLASVRSDISWASSFTYNYGDVVAHVRCTRLEYTQFVFKVISMKYWNDDLFPNRWKFQGFTSYVKIGHYLFPKVKARVVVGSKLLQVHIAALLSTFFVFRGELLSFIVSSVEISLCTIILLKLE